MKAVRAMATRSADWSALDGNREDIRWIAVKCRAVADLHLELADEAESMLNRLGGSPRCRSGLRTLARFHRSSALQLLEWVHLASDPKRAPDHWLD